MRRMYKGEQPKAVTEQEALLMIRQRDNMSSLIYRVLNKDLKVFGYEILPRELSNVLTIDEIIGCRHYHRIHMGKIEDLFAINNNDDMISHMALFKLAHIMLGGVSISDFLELIEKFRYTANTERMNKMITRYMTTLPKEQHGYFIEETNKLGYTIIIN